MSRYLLDTNALSEVVRKRPEPVVLARLRDAAASDLTTSAVCVMELRFGAARHPRGAALWERIEREVLSRVQALPVSESVAVRAGDLLAHLAGGGEPIGVEDVLIGATALDHRLRLVTRNIRHFRRIPGLLVESWWP